MKQELNYYRVEKELTHQEVIELYQKTKKELDELKSWKEEAMEFMNKFDKSCPKCGSPQKSPKLDGTTARIWFTCGSYGYADKPDQVFRSSDKCLDREEINTLQRKVEELQVELDFANEAVDQRERSRKDAETELRNVKAAGDYWHSKWKEACENARIKHKEVCELKRERNRLIDGLQASTIHSCGDSCSRPMCVLRRERDAYKRAKQENDERFMNERDVARQERNQLRDCAVRLAGSIATSPIVPTNAMKAALADWERLKEESK